ncbi:high affinity copper uptake protein 1-like isoform X2 [Ostrea edulis]|uniref:high affinity copper uptake protein 1-like isoform X2 n=1 Tax=Ostrea edulis TaxID=37623 RepID=UPI0024AF14F7|nr:high affinity copper uptake protein 1-like isoform X2 [Ostrea edulis]XP_056011284.1 high affinity copper uptake protein 1-like isoform X2 [Ostrea edulis]XP_056011285.1 high affinity copper uptake protein 1-like isoform X2 [Ostrea edulis]XP_056011286.1 high affinity copper uptake protein 1-like isoform X2 [Ostrea edulis]XP_056011287.1 high affinity copper uptake protein 1-like isoform X2 [Ostrea edulis]
MNHTMNSTMSSIMDMNSTGMNHHHHHMHSTTGMPMDHHNHGNMDGNMDGSMQDHSMHMGNDTDSCGNGMAMFFHTGKCEYLLFEGVQTKTVAGMVGACIIIFLLAVLYEGLKVFREYLLKKALVTGSKYQEVTIGANGKSVVPDAQVKSSNGLSSIDYKPEKKQSIGISMISSSHLLQTLLHVLQVFISYCLMLVFMTYNVWLCIAVILGAGTGYFFFGWKRAVVVDVNEHCH